MSTKSDEFEQLNYSFISSEKNINNEEKEFINKVNDMNKKQSLTKSLSSSGLNIQKIKNKNMLPNINKFKKNKIKLGKNSNLTSNSINNSKNNSFVDKAYRTYNLVKNDFILNINDKQNNINILKESKKENHKYMPTENNNQIKPKDNESKLNIKEQKNNLINILFTKDNNNKKEETKNIFYQDSQRIKKEYNNIQSEYAKKRNNIKALKEEEKISREDELKMKNNVLTEQIKKLNYLYFDALQKLIEYEESIKNIHKVKESKLKNEYILIELEYKYNQVVTEMEKNNKKFEELKCELNKKNSELKQCQKTLDYYSQLNQKLLLDAENIEMNPKILALKNEYETKIIENQKSLAFYKEENFKKDKILLELNCENRNINDLYNSVNNINNKDKCSCFKNAQKLSKEYFIKKKENIENKEIIRLKNRINVLQEKINKLSFKNKEYEDNERCLKRYKSNNSKKNKKNNLEINDYNFNKNNIKNNFPQLIIEKSSSVNYLLFPKKEDRDIDFMSNLNMNEFLYILKKCFEAQSINISDIKDKILNSSIFNILKINNKSNYDSFINKVSENIFKLIKVEKSKDLNDIYSFVKTFLFNNFIENGNNIEEFQKIFVNVFKGINNYDKNVEEKYLKKLVKCLNDKVGKLKNEFEFIDFNQKGIISFIALKKVIEKLKLNIKNDVLEYMIFFMKRASINDSKNINNYSLRHLNYKIFLEKISSLINSNNNIDLSNSSNLSEIEPNNFEGGFNTNITDENSLIEITNEEYNEKLTLILNSISSEIIKKSNKNTGEYINKLFEREITTDQIGHQIIELSKFVERIKNSLFIELNQIEIFCLYSRFQFNDNNKINNTELIDFKSFKNEILLYVNQLKNTKNISYDVLNEKNNNGNNAIKDINILNENDDIKTDDKEDINKQNEEYNDFEKNNFDSVI